MALGQKRFRLRDSLHRNSLINKKLDFHTLEAAADTETSVPLPSPALLRLDSSAHSDYSFSPCHTRSGTVYKPKTLKFGDTFHDDSDSEGSDNVFDESSLELRPLDGFDHEMSPIVSKKPRSSTHTLNTSPCFLKRRQRTSTRILAAVPSSQEAAAGSCREAASNPVREVTRRRRRRRRFSSEMR